MENDILYKLNKVAKEYTTSKNLIRNINKRYVDTFKIVSCEESGCGYRVASVLDIGNNSYKYKLYEKDNQVYFKRIDSKDSYSLEDVSQILRGGEVTEISIDSLTIKLDNLTAEDYEIMLKVLGKR